MYLSRYLHLYDFPRIRIPEPKRFSGVMRLNRNEKPDSWPMDLLNRIFSSVPEDLLQRYPDPEPVYTKLANFLGVAKEWLLLTSGVDEAIRTIITLSCEPGDTFAVTWPGYAMYDVYARMYSCRLAPIVYMPDRFTTAGELCSTLPSETKVLFLPNPSQPVENCFPLDDLAEIAGCCRHRNILLAVDEAYCFFGAPTAIPLIKRFDNLLVMRSFSKAFGAASLRLGYVVGSRSALAPLSAFRLAHEANGLSLHAASVLLDCFDSHVKPSIESICQGRDFLRCEANGHGLPAWGQFGNHVLIDLITNGRAALTAQRLEAKGILVKRGFAEPLDHHIQVTCGPPEMMKSFLTALLEVLED